MTRARGPWLITFVTLVFGAGVAAGVPLQQSLQPAPLARERPMRPSAAAVVEMLGEELQLTSTQQAALKQLVMNRRQAFEATRAAMRERMNDEASDLDNEIRTKLDLTPEQRERFEAFVTRVRARFLDEGPPR
jgi:hypothetical protein